MVKYGYHCTNIDPEIILKNRFKSGMKGGYSPSGSSMHQIETLCSPSDD